MSTSENRFYVYEHLRSDTGAVFYVGKGTGKRYAVRSHHHRNETRSNEERKRASVALSGRIQTKIECPHCGKIGGNAMRRWHFENCKAKS